MSLLLGAFEKVGDFFCFLEGGGWGSGKGEGFLLFTTFKFIWGKKIQFEYFF